MAEWAVDRSEVDDFEDLNRKSRTYYREKRINKEYSWTRTMRQLVDVYPVYFANHPFWQSCAVIHSYEYRICEICHSGSTN